ncbi:MAG: hypothetical protein JO131_05325, partial [Gammaproteobacteria bacterium]|nr:hypothetical protein [Gammaproteobacteria bacterium]
NVQALASDYCGILNIATGIPETLNNLLHYIEQVGEKAIEPVFAKPRLSDIVKSYGATHKAANQIGFHAQVSLEKGIRDLILTP